MPENIISSEEPEIACGTLIRLLGKDMHPDVRRLMDLDFAHKLRSIESARQPQWLLRFLSVQAINLVVREVLWPHVSALVTRHVAREQNTPPPSITDEEHAIADGVRAVWADALRSVKDFAAVRSRENVNPPDVWYGALRISSLADARVFPSLPPIWTVMDARDAVAPEAFGREYGLDKDEHTWRLGDRLLLGLHRAADGDTAQIKRLIQLFLFHEYIHEHNRLTKYTSRGVGAFPNCLEHLDYAADLYAMFHQVAWAEMYDRARVENDDAKRVYLAELIDLALRSFWAFDQPLPRHEWQVRRLRRYLNWYWRHVQVKRSTSLETAVWTLARRPAIELAGITQRADGRRVFANVAERIVDEDLELGIVLENEQLLRISDSQVTEIGALLAAFANGDHTAIQRFFAVVYEEAVTRRGQFAEVVR